MIVGERIAIFAPNRRNVQINLYPLGDLHIGNRACDMERLKEDIKRIKEDPYAVWIGMGDYADYIAVNDRRWDARIIADDIKAWELGELGYALTQRVRDLFKPIKDKCLGLLFGNHEFKYMREMEQMQLHDWLCTELGVCNLGYSCFLRVLIAHSVKKDKVEVKRISTIRESTHPKSTWNGFTLFAHHGFGTGRTKGGKINRVIDAMRYFEADIYLLAHVHDKQPIETVQLRLNKRTLTVEEKRKVGVITGTYLRTYPEGITTYSEQKLYPPTATGTPIVQITSHKDGGINFRVLL